MVSFLPKILDQQSLLIELEQSENKISLKKHEKKATGTLA